MEGHVSCYERAWRFSVIPEGFSRCMKSRSHPVAGRQHHRASRSTSPLDLSVDANATFIPAKTST